MAGRGAVDRPALGRLDQRPLERVELGGVVVDDVLQLDPDLVEVHMNLGLLYEMAGERARARASLETFLAKASPAQYGSILPRVREKLASLR